VGFYNLYLYIGYIHWDIGKLLNVKGLNCTIFDNVIRYRVRIVSSLYFFKRSIFLSLIFFKIPQC